MYRKKLVNVFLTDLLEVSIPLEGLKKDNYPQTLKGHVSFDNLVENLLIRQSFQRPFYKV